MGKAKKKGSRSSRAPARRATSKNRTASKKTAKRKAAKKKAVKKKAATKKAARSAPAKRKTKKTAARKTSTKKSSSRASTKTNTEKSTTGKARKTGSAAAQPRSSKASRTSTSRAGSKAMTLKKSTTRKTVAKKPSAKKTTTRAKASTGRKATKAQASPSPKKTVKKAAKVVAVRRRRKSLSLAEISELPTEKLWSLYRVEANKKASGPTKRLEELRNILIERHYPLVRYIAERLLQTLPKSIELDDLISAGLFGLMDAIRGFDASRGIKFKTYCSTRIRGAILDQLRSQDWVPRLVRLKASRIERALQRLTAAYGREPTHAELARSLEMDHQDLVKELQEARAKTMFSLSEKWEDDDGSVEKIEVLEDKTAIDPVGELNRLDLMSYITRALTHKERFIIEQYYQYGHTMREIGEMLALTESRVCQIHSNVMGRLNSLLGQKQHQLLS